MPSTIVAPLDDSLYGMGGFDQSLINSELTRTIRDEVADVDKSIKVTMGNIKNEQLSFSQLTKQCNHARDEMYKRRRDAAEVVQSESTMEDCRLAFKDTFVKDIAPHVVSPSSSNNIHDHGILSDDMDEDGSPSPKSHKSFIERKKAEAKKKSASIRGIQKEIVDTRKKIKAAVEDMDNYNQDIASRQLEKVKMDGERQVEAKRRSLEAEMQRNRGVKDSVQNARNNSGAYAQQIAEKVRMAIFWGWYNLLCISFSSISALIHIHVYFSYYAFAQANEQMSERESNRVKEAALASINVTKQQELAALEDDEKKIDKELAKLEGQLDFLVKQTEQFEAEQKKSADMKVETEEIERNVAEVVSNKEDKTKEAEASNADLQSALSSFEEATTAVAEANAEKVENDKAMVEVLEPANVRKADAIKEKENLAGEVVALQNTIEQAQNSNKETATNSEAKVVAKTNELKEEKTKLDKARAELEEMKKNDSTAESTLLGELKEYKEFAKKFEAATKAEVDRLAVLKRERIEARLEHIARRRSELDVVESSNRDDIDNLKQLNSYLQEMKGKKALIEEEALLDRNGIRIEISFSQEYDTASIANEDGSRC